MALSGSRLTSALAADILTALQTQFPVSGSLLPAEQTALNTAQQHFATAIANGSGADIITEIIGHAVVSTTDVGTVTSGAGSGGTVAATGTGTVA